jgi:hypothetical protein
LGRQAGAVGEDVEVSSPVSKSEARALSKRLRESGSPDPSDLAKLGDLLVERNGALGEVSDGLSSIGLSATTRLKTSGTIVEKLKRQPTLDLLSIHDLAGARIVQPMTLDQQDQVATRILNHWPGARYIDRRGENNSHGYRAVHIVPRVDGHPVEIQIRTRYQDLWAQVMETFGDVWGREVRYGGLPTDPDTLIVSSNPVTRRDLVMAWIGYSPRLHAIATVENELARVRAQPGAPQEQLDHLEQTIKSTSKPIIDLGEQLLQVFGRPTDG